MVPFLPTMFAYTKSSSVSTVDMSSDIQLLHVVCIFIFKLWLYFIRPSSLSNVFTYESSKWSDLFFNSLASSMAKCNVHIRCDRAPAAAVQPRRLQRAAVRVRGGGRAVALRPRRLLVLGADLGAPRRLDQLRRLPRRRRLARGGAPQDAPPHRRLRRPVTRRPQAADALERRERARPRRLHP